MHIDILVGLVKAYRIPRYLEIGVGDGYCFEQVAVHCKSAVAVDVPENPHGNGRVNLIASSMRHCHFYADGSDHFFSWWDTNRTFDLIFIDGSHWAEQVAFDVHNALNVLAENGTLAMHDTWAANAEDARNGSDTAWQIARDYEGDERFQTFTLPVRPGLTLLRRNTPRSYA